MNSSKMLKKVFLFALCMFCIGCSNLQCQPCDNVSCGANSHCEDTNNKGVCVCDPGYHQSGQQCVMNENQPPNKPSNIQPTNLSTGVATDVTLQWTGGDPDGDAVTYSVFLDEAISPTTVQCKDSAQTSCYVTNLKNNTNYYWMVRATDSKGATVNSEVWRFTTIPSDVILPEWNSASKFMVTDFGSASAKFLWEPAVGNLDHYYIYKSDTSGPNYFRAVAKIGSSEIKATVTQLKPDRGYKFKIVACNKENYCTTDDSANRPPTIDIATKPIETIQLNVPTSTANVQPFPAFHVTNEFIFNKDSGVQKFMDNNVIEVKRFSVITGLVTSRSGTALRDVLVTVKDHPELGYTYSRSDGRFEMAINSGGAFSISFSKEYYLTVMRTVTVNWNTVIKPIEVAMTEQDSNVKQAIAGTVVNGVETTSENGFSRTPKLLIPTGTQASIMKKDGNPITWGSPLNLRFTEFTYGPNGLKAMPGELPESTGYTYALEISADEAQDLDGGDTVEFNQFVYFYLVSPAANSFLKILPGEVIPVGYYDRDKAAWAASPNGRVIKKIGASGGKAILDVDGQGQASSAKLNALGITDEELTKLAADDVAKAGDIIWRVPIRHLTPYDLNWPYGPPANSCSPNDKTCQLADIGNGKTDDCPDKISGSIIECQNQVLGEEVPVVGTPYSLVYRSSRTKGYKAASKIDIPLTGNNIPSELVAIELEIKIDSKTDKIRYEKSKNEIIPNMSYTYQWDQTDLFHQQEFGQRSAIVSIGYVYSAVYYAANPDPNLIYAWAVDGDKGKQIIGPMTLDRDNMTITRWYNYTVPVSGSMSFAGNGLGGWTLNVQNFYDNQRGIEYFGSGGWAQKDAIGGITTLAGCLECHEDWDYSVDTPALNVQLSDINGLAIGSDGTVYYYSSNKNGIYKIKDGVISAFVTNIDGNSITPIGIATAPNGNIYFTVRNNMYYYDFSETSGNVIKTVSFKQVFSGMLGQTTAIAIAKDGTIFFNDENNSVIWKRNPVDGSVTNIAGIHPDQVGKITPDGITATKTVLDLIDHHRLAIAPDGSILFAEHGSDNGKSGDIIRRVTPDGNISIAVGKLYSTTYECPDYYELGGKQALEVCLDDYTLFDVLPSGRIVFYRSAITVSRLGYIYEVDDDHVIRYVAGIKSYEDDYGTKYLDCYKDNIQPDQKSVCLDLITDIKYGPDNHIYISDTNGDGNRIRKFYRGNSGSTIPSSLVRFDPNATNNKNLVWIASADGKIINYYDENGYHVKTVDSITGVILYSFNIDKTTGYLLSVTDKDGRVTSFTRDNQTITIKNKYNDVTSITTNSDYIRSITNPHNETYFFTYYGIDYKIERDDLKGLLRSLKNPRGYITTFDYDLDDGRLIADTDARNKIKALSRPVKGQKKQEVDFTSPEGRVTKYITEYKDDSIVKTKINPDNTSIVSEMQTDKTVNTYSDGTVITVNTDKYDPRFGSMSPLEEYTIETGNGLKNEVKRYRKVLLSDYSDPLSLIVGQNSYPYIDIISINGKQYTLSYYRLDDDTGTFDLETPEHRHIMWHSDLSNKIGSMYLPGLRGPLQFDYDEDSKIKTITQNDRIIIYNWINGKLEQVDYPENISVKMTYDGAWRLHTITQAPSTTNEAQTRLDYDNNGNLIYITTPKMSFHVFNYDELDRVNSYRPTPLGDGIDYTEVYGYNNDNQQTTYSKPNGMGSITVQYDKITGKAFEIDTTDGDKISAQYYQIYGKGDPNISNSGKLKSLTKNNSESILTYDYNGYLLNSETWTGIVTGFVQKGYNNDFKVVSTDVNGKVVTYNYDNDGLITQAGDLGITRNDVHGQIISSSIDNIQVTYPLYSNTGELNQYAVAFKGSPVYSYQINDRYKNGKIKKRTENIGGQEVIWEYQYDNVGRLIGAGKNGVWRYYNYDLSGNRILADGYNSTFDYQDRQTSKSNSGPFPDMFEYLSDGTMISQHGSNSLGNIYRDYDLFGKIKNVHGGVPDYLMHEYKHDPIGRLIKKDNKLYIYYNALNPAAEVDGNGVNKAAYVYGTRINTPDYMILKDGTKYYFVTDHLGSVRMIVNTVTGEIKHTVEYDEWGVITSETGDLTLHPFRFAGGLDMDGYYKFGARYYDPANGRWTQKDPILFAGGDVNLYGYVMGDPVNWVDPFGLKTLTGVGIAGEIMMGVGGTIIGLSYFYPPAGLLGGVVVVVGAGLTLYDVFEGITVDAPEKAEEYNKEIQNYFDDYFDRLEKQTGDCYKNKSSEKK